MARRTARTPNAKLAHLLDQTRCGQGEFARFVNRVGTESGFGLSYGQTAVAHWLTGTSPMARFQPVVLEALSRKLGRKITAFDAGFAGQQVQSPQSGDTLAGLIDLGSADMEPSRRGVLTAGLYSVALAIPGWTDLTDRFERIAIDPHSRIGFTEVEAVKAMTEKISDLDDQFGGKATRPMSATFLVNTVVPYLKADGPDEVKRAMLSAAADHLYLTGYMAMDERADRLAQDYYVQALEMAAWPPGTTSPTARPCEE